MGEGFVRIFVPVRKKSFAGKVVLITGAGHGIGRELALKFNSVGARLALWDINKDNVERVVKEINALGGNATSYICDVSKSEMIRSIADKVSREIGDVDVLVNNAGILHGGSLLTLTEEEIRKTFDINLFGYMWTCRTFLPTMINRNDGHVINIASASAIRGVAYLTDYSYIRTQKEMEQMLGSNFTEIDLRPYKTVTYSKSQGASYCLMFNKIGICHVDQTEVEAACFTISKESSKCAVRGFTEAIADEMRREGHTNIHFTCVFPMFVNTGMTKYMHDRTGQVLSPKEVANAVVEGAQMNKKSIFIPANMDWMSAIGALLPRRYLDDPSDLMYKGIDPQK